MPLVRNAILGAACVCLLTDCFGSWEDTEFIDQVAWADDDGAIALTVLRYEQKPSANPLNGTPNKRNWRHQVYVEAPNGTGRAAVSAEIPGQNGAEFYYMRDAGYLVLSALDGSGRWFNRIDIDGTVTEIARFANDDCQSRFFDVVPSPDGAHLALIHSAPGCVGTGFDGPPSPTGSNTTATQLVQVTFLDGATLATVASQSLELSNWNLEWTWTPARAFIVTDNTSAWSLAPGRAPRAAQVPGCAWPKTTSSVWSSQGVFIYGDGDRVKTGGTSPDEAFGCQ